MVALAERTMQDKFLAPVIAQDLANTARTYATLDLKNKALMEALGEWTMQEEFPST